MGSLTPEVVVHLAGEELKVTLRISHYIWDLEEELDFSVRTDFFDSGWRIGKVALEKCLLS